MYHRVSLPVMSAPAEASGRVEICLFVRVLIVGEDSNDPRACRPIIWAERGQKRVRVSNNLAKKERRFAKKG